MFYFLCRNSGSLLIACRALVKGDTCVCLAFCIFFNCSSGNLYCYETIIAEFTIVIVVCNCLTKQEFSLLSSFILINLV